MTIKLEDIRIGDKVTLHAKIVEDGWANGSFVANVGGARVGIAGADIATHTPAPREFKPGEIVRIGAGVTHYRFIAEDDGYAFVALIGDEPTRRILPVCDLRHADAPVPPPQEPVKERKKIEAWVNVYQGDDFGKGHKSRLEADDAATTRRIACLHVEGYEGDGL
jgi:hypothetical protein